MRRILNVLSILLLIVITTNGQQLFEKIDENEISSNLRSKRTLIPEASIIFKTNHKALLEVLSSAPGEKDFQKRRITKDLILINPKGQYEQFQIFETDMIEPGLGAKYPSIKTYKGYLKSNPSVNIYLGIGKNNFYATIDNGALSYSIDRYAKGQSEYYQSYFHNDYNPEGFPEQISCGTQSAKGEIEQNFSSSRSNTALVPLQKFRFAVATTGEFSNRYGPEKEDVLEEVVKSVNRMNQILEIDLAVRLILVENNDKVIFMDPDTDPFSDGTSGGTLLSQNTNVLNVNLGFSNYDIGHVYTTGCSDTGGIAFIRSLCAANKGGGVTCHYLNDITTIAVRVAAHEVGHQFGANHTFNNCNGNENGGTAYEPGSGSTIMSYGGLCGPNLNIVGQSDDYYHVASLIEINNYFSTAFVSNCVETDETNNHEPEVFLEYENGFYIPVSTPFELTGEAFDEDEDNLSFTWEQYNLGPSSALGAPTGNSPSFRSVYPSSSPTRYFPNMNTILSNDSDRSEVLPTYDRDFSFQFVVRDNNQEAGSAKWERVDFKSTTTAGPFEVVYPNSRDSFFVGQEVEILWDVANTNNPVVNCQSVDILLSRDNGQNFDFVLSEKTANDGSEKVIIPNTISNTVRIKIKASDNIFFDVSNELITIEEPEEAGFAVDFSPGYAEICVPDQLEIRFTSEGFLGFEDTLDIILPDNLNPGIEFVLDKDNFLPGEGNRLSFDFVDPTLSGLFDIPIQIIGGEDTLDRVILLNLKSADFSDIQVVSPLPSSSGNSVGQTLRWTKDSDADSYFIQLSDNPSFNKSDAEIYFETVTTDSFFVLPDILAKGKVYYWNVKASNNCGESPDGIPYRFVTEALSCSIYEYTDLPQGISPSAAVTIEMPIDVFAAGEISDVNLFKLRGSHSWVSELRAELISPAGTEVLLFDRKCGNQADFNLGFDDESNTAINCPLNQGIFYQPEESLNAFNGELIEGEWVLKLRDTQAGNGGSVQEYKLELCSNETLESPFLQVNDTMPLPFGEGRRISNEYLLSEDGNNDEDEIIYTLLGLPQFGTLRLESDTLGVGSRFSQDDINNLRLRYQHDGENMQDQFIFIVEDGEGGWLDLDTFNIVVDNTIVLNTDNTYLDKLKIYPNPNSGIFFLELDNDGSDYRIDLFDLSGRKIVHQLSRNGNIYRISAQKVIPGMYLVRLIQKDQIQTFKITIN